MIPLRLCLTNFLSYHQKTEIDFQPIHLACISGNNGAGKSSLLDAITWALFGRARRADDALIFGNMDECEVVLEFAYEGDHYRIRRLKPRGKTGVLEFFFKVDDTGDWRNITEKSLRETEARIAQTLRMDYETFTNASFFLQGKADQFAQQKPGDRKRILGSILGLDIWETYKEKAAEKRKAVEREINTLDARLQDTRQELGEEDQRKETLRQLEARLADVSQRRQDQEKLLDQFRQIEGAVKEQKKTLDTLNGQLNNLLANRRQTESRLQMRLNEQDGIQTVLKQSDQIRADHGELIKIRARLEQMNLLAGQVHELENRRLEPQVSMEKKKAARQQEQQHLLQQKRQVDEITAQETVMEVELTQLLEKMSADQPLVESRPQIEDQITHLNQQAADLKSENTRLHAEMDEIKKRQVEFEGMQAGQCPTCGQELSPDHIHRMVDDLGTQGVARGDVFRANKKALENLLKELEDLNVKRKEIAQAETRLTALQRRHDQIVNWLEQNQPIQTAWQKTGSERLKEVEAELASGSYLQAEQSALDAITAELAALSYDPAVHQQLRKQESELKATEEKLLHLEKAAASLTPVEREIGDLRAALQQNQEQQIVLQDQIGQIEGSYQQMTEKLPDMLSAEKSHRALFDEENHIRKEVGAASQKVNVLKDLKKKEKELNAEREERATLSGRYRTLEKAFSKDGVPALLIEQALPEIEAQANDILDRLSGGAMSIRFLTQRDYKDKSRDDKKETLDIQISDPSGIRDYEMFSGGEAFRVNFAIRLALSRVLAGRSGARLQTLVIDEGFGSQDASGRQRLIEAINMVQNDFAKVLVITHLEELKDAFPHRIEVEKQSVGSTVRVLT